MINYITIGGIKYRIRIKYDSFWVLTLPHGKIEYKVSIDPNTHEVQGLPITFGLHYNRIYGQNK